MLSIGVLAGIWPCGVVIFVAELFVSESKSQVYGILHDFCQTNADSTKNISKYHTISFSHSCALDALPKINAAGMHGLHLL